MYERGEGEKIVRNMIAVRKLVTLGICAYALYLAIPLVHSGGLYTTLVNALWAIAHFCGG